MPFDLTSTALVVIALLLVIVLLLVAWRVGLRRQAREAPPYSPESVRHVDQARLDPGERPSSLVSEQIEEMVRANIQAYPDLAQLKLDFATDEEGGLDVWVDDRKYDSVDEIPDERLRSAVRQAVDSFNR